MASAHWSACRPECASTITPVPTRTPGRAIPYDAFISYRRVEPDLSIARLLHRRLERFRAPRSLIRLGVRRQLAPIFLDAHELDIGSLSETIRSALAASRYFVLICSRHTRDSLWIADEIREFRRLHPAGRLWFLALERDPAACLPADLGVPAAGGSILETEIEPSTIPIERNQRGAPRLSRRVEAQLLAALLECDLATLERAIAKRTRLRRGWAALTGAALAAAALWGAVAFNSRTVWHAVRTPTIGRQSGPFVAARVLPSKQLLVLGPAGELQTVNMVRAAPKLDRTISQPGQIVSDRWGSASPSGNRQLIAVREPTGEWSARVFDVQSGQQFRIPAGMDPLQTAEAAFAGNENDIALFPDPTDSTVALHSLLEGQPVVRLAGLSGAMPWSNFSPTPPQIRQQILASNLWSSRELRRFLGPILVGGRRAVGLWDTDHADQGARALTATPEAQMMTFAAHHESMRVAILEAVLPDRLVVSVWSLSDGHLLRQREFVGWHCSDVAFSPDGEHLVLSGERFAVLRSADLDTELDAGAARWTLLYPRFAHRSLAPLRLSRQTPKLLLVATGGRASLWDPNRPAAPSAAIADIDLEAMLDPEGYSEIVTNEAADRLLIDRNGSLELWDLEAGRRAWSASVPSGSTLAYSLEENAVTATSPSGELRVFDAASGEILTTVSLGRSSTFVSAFDRECERIWVRTGFEEIRIAHGRELFTRFTPSRECD